LGEPDGRHDRILPARKPTAIVPEGPGPTRSARPAAGRPRGLARRLYGLASDRAAPVTPQLILSFIAERALGLPKSY